jgi:ABC-type spermidine/putrescine transport system permease subunit II
MRKNVGLKIFAGLVFAFLLVPLLIIIVTSFGTNSTIQFPIKGFTLDWYSKVFNNESFMVFQLLILWHATRYTDEIGLKAFFFRQQLYLVW